MGIWEEEILSGRWNYLLFSWFLILCLYLPCSSLHPHSIYSTLYLC
jgi:hypothetical protein